MFLPTRVGRSLSLAVVISGLVACEETELPVIPEHEPRFTVVAVDALDSTPQSDVTMQAGTERTFSFTAYYQVASDWDSEDLDILFLVRSWSNEAFVRYEYVDFLPVTDDHGTVRFQGAFTVPNCGSIDEVDLVVQILPADDWSSYIWQDGWTLSVASAGSTPCV